MECNEYGAEIIAAQRLAELREQSARLALVTEGRLAPRLSRRLAATLIRLGHRLAEGRPARARNAGVRLAR